MVHLAYLSFSLSLSNLQFFVPPFSYALNCKRKFLRVRILVPMTKKTTCCIHVRAQKKLMVPSLLSLSPYTREKRCTGCFLWTMYLETLIFISDNWIDNQIELNFCDWNGKNLPWVKIIVNNYTILTRFRLMYMLTNIFANIKPGKFRLRKPWFKAGISMRKYIYLKPSFPLSFHRLCRKIWVKNLT